MSSSSGLRLVTGQVVATNAIINILTVGFMPKKIRVYNLTNAIQVEWFDALPVGTNLKSIADGAQSTITSGVEPLNDSSSGNFGIKIPVLADINDTTTEVLVWEAFG
jgi:hypothetical protein